MEETKQGLSATALSDALTRLDDDLIASAEEARQGKYARKRQRATIVRFGTYAIAAALLVGVGISALRLRNGGTHQASVATTVSEEALAELAYVEVSELLSDAPENDKTGSIIKDFDDTEVPDVFKAGEATDFVVSMPYDGSATQVVRLRDGDETVLFSRLAVSEEGYARLPESIGEAFGEETGWYLVLGHETADYLICEDSAGNWSLWERLE